MISAVRIYSHGIHRSRFFIQYDHGDYPLVSSLTILFGAASSPRKLRREHDRAVLCRFVYGLTGFWAGVRAMKSSICLRF
ncbi:hypothetical protein PL9631_710065 [Planktothrix paucivesiculata PCC 9631]|uniref:Uncharacterized protein n=1 Tax=Planktothrix paucivesiculata PCC 9631 TaxID=671071 RepID=A0A7Z9C189_9CYAN|nr:hypothetical protein PL9631_710065 [Planktothrix paucivesiculata PCC 9631]